MKKREVIKARKNYTKLNDLSYEIIDLAEQLAFALRTQRELFETSGFHKSDYQSSLDMFHHASENNYLFESYLAD